MRRDGRDDLDAWLGYLNENVFVIRDAFLLFTAERRVWPFCVYDVILFALARGWQAGRARTRRGPRTTQPKSKTKQADPTSKQVRSVTSGASVSLKPPERNVGAALWQCQWPIGGGQWRRMPKKARPRSLPINIWTGGRGNRSDLYAVVASR